MTEAELNSLRHGDIILIDRGERSYLRTVIEGPADRVDSRPNVTVPIRRRSWTKRIHTILDRYFLLNHARYTGIKAKQLMGGDELSNLMDRGWNVAREIIRELEEERARKARGCRQSIKPDRCKVIAGRLIQTAKQLASRK